MQSSLHGPVRLSAALHPLPVLKAGFDLLPHEVLGC